MTKEELGNKHLTVLRELTPLQDPLLIISTEHRKISIEYAISVLEELRDYLISIYHNNSAAHTENKIQELKTLIK